MLIRNRGEKLNILKIIPAFTDERGSISDLIFNQEVNAVTIITFTKGAIRANHFHKRTVQWNYIISGEVLIVTQLPGLNRVENILKKGEFLMTQENERHALQALTEAEVLVITKGPRAGIEYENDTFRLDVPLIAEKR